MKPLTAFLLSCVAVAAFGQSTTPENKPAPRTADGKPDFNGLWGPDRNFIYDITSTLKKGESLPSQPDDPDPTWYGHSIAKWEGDTLVVDSVGFNDKFWFDFAGHPHTEKLHVIERYRRPDFDHLEYDTTVDDPGAYTKPFTLHGHSVYQHNDDLIEYICNENNKDVGHIVGK